MENKKRYFIIAISACLLMFMVKTCETDDYSLRQQEDLGVEEIKKIQNQSDSLLTEVLHEFDTRQHQYNDELDSLNQLISGEGLSKAERMKLEKKIKDTQKLLEAAKEERNTIVVNTEEAPDSVAYNIILKDSIVYNIVEKDSIVYNIIEKDSIVYNIMYEIDTIHYKSDEIKKLKLKKD